MNEENGRSSEFLLFLNVFFSVWLAIWCLKIGDIFVNKGITYLLVLGNEYIFCVSTVSHPRNNLQISHAELIGKRNSWLPVFSHFFSA